MLKSTLTVLTLPSLCGVACAAVPAGSPRTEDGPSKPDIILILTDQQSYNTISALGHTLASTPNLDRLVRQGITFTNAYCANPLSVPSRYALFTGTSPAGVGVWGNADRNTDAEKIRQAQEQSIGAVFRRAGYQTLYGGKIHLPNAKNKSKFAGTDNYFFEYIEKDERELLARNVGMLLREREATQPMLLVVSFLNPHDICFEARTDAEVEATLATEGKDRLKAQTIVQMRALADGADPAEYPPLPENFERTENLGPIQFPYKEFTTDYWRRYRFIYGRLVELVDRQIGEVLDAVEASANRDNTIVVFTSDHGEMAGAHQLITKGVPYDECQHVPLIIAGRDVVQGERDHSLVCNGWDLLPTLCGLAGIEAPSNGCGISLAGRAFGREELTPGRFLYLETTRSCLHRRGQIQIHTLQKQRSRDADRSGERPARAEQSGLRSGVCGQTAGALLAPRCGAVATGNCTLLNLQSGARQPNNAPYETNSFPLRNRYAALPDSARRGLRSSGTLGNSQTRTPQFSGDRL